MMNRHGSCLGDEGYGRSEVDVTFGPINGAAEDAVDVVVVHRPLVASRNDPKGAVFLVHVVEENAGREHILIGVRVERPVLVPFNWGPFPAGFMLSLVA